MSDTDATGTTSGQPLPLRWEVNDHTIAAVVTSREFPKLDTKTAAVVVGVLIECHGGSCATRDEMDETLAGASLVVWPRHGLIVDPAPPPWGPGAFAGFVGLTKRQAEAFLDALAVRNLATPEVSRPTPDRLRSLEKQFVAPSRLYSRDEVLSVPYPVPQSPGVYGWWFSRLPYRLDSSGCRRSDGRTLLYAGISPRAAPSNGSPESRETLRSRIRTHFCGNAEGSTLRKTLGSLLSEELRIELRRVGSGNRMTFVEGEQILSEWMSEHAYVAWIETSEPWVFEEYLITQLDLPLNLAGNKQNRFHAELTRQRAASTANARALEVLPNPGRGGR